MHIVQFLIAIQSPTDLYFCAFDGDPIFLKALVLVVFAMGTVSTTLLSILAYSVIMVGTFSPSQLDLRKLGSHSALSLIGHMGISNRTYPCSSLHLKFCLGPSIIQIYYAHRIRRLCGSYPIPALILLVRDVLVRRAHVFLIF